MGLGGWGGVRVRGGKGKVQATMERVEEVGGKSKGKVQATKEREEGGKGVRVRGGGG